MDKNKIREVDKLNALRWGNMRIILSQVYLKGSGIEIGGLNEPLRIDTIAADIRYVDRMDRKRLYEQYPHIKEDEMVEVNIVDDGEKLHKIDNRSLDFIVANHFLEHCQNPLGTLRNFIGKLKDNGILFLAVPTRHKESWDADRETTPFEHLLKDEKDEGQNSKHGHYREWVTLVDKKDANIAHETQKMIDLDQSIHFHVWDNISLIDFIYQANQYLGLPVQLESYQNNDGRGEAILILRKVRECK